MRLCLSSGGLGSLPFRLGVKGMLLVTLLFRLLVTKLLLILESPPLLETRSPIMLMSVSLACFYDCFCSNFFLPRIRAFYKELSLY